MGTVVRKRAAQPGKYDTQWSVGLFVVAKATSSRNPVIPDTYRLRPHGAAPGAPLVPGVFSHRDLQEVPVGPAGGPLQLLPPPPVLRQFDDETGREYRPLRVFEARRRRGRDEVLVSWRGFRRNEAVWVPRADIAGTEALRRWDAAQP